MRRLVVSRHGSLPNIILDSPVVPELVQENCTAEKIATSALDVLGPGGSAQRVAFQDVMQALGQGGTPPGDRAASSVLRKLGVSGAHAET